MKYKFPRKLRLTTEEQFKKVYKARRKEVTEVFTIYSCRECNIDYPRMGVIVPKKQVKEAAKRNYLKRAVREFFRLNRQKLGKIDLVILVKRKAEDLSRKELKMFLEKQIEKLLL